MSRLLASSCLVSLLLAAPAGAAEPFKPSRISVQVRGSGPDVILIPGLASSPGIWRSAAAAVPGYRYHLVQVNGFAGTPASGNASGPVASPVADEIVRYIEANRLKRPAIVGHSMGGSIALMIGARHAAAGRVMVVDMLPSPVRPFGVPRPAMKPLAKLVAGQLQGADRLKRDLRPLVSRFGSPAWMESRSDSGVVARSVEELMATDLTPELGRIRAPLTVVYACPSKLSYACGQVSRTFTRAYAPRPGTKLVRIERSGHSIMLDQPAAFQAELRAFLSDRPSP